MTVHPHQKFVQQGFTLFELLLVIAVVAIMASAVVISLNPDNTHRDLEKEARRLAQVLRQLADEAIFQGQEFGLLVKEDSYKFAVWNRDDNKWLDFNSGAVFRDYALPDFIQMSMSSAAISYSLELTKSDSNSTYADQMNGADESAAAEIVPAAWFLSSGEITPFSLTLFVRDNSERRYVISADAVGEIILKTPDQVND